MADFLTPILDAIVAKITALQLMIAGEPVPVVKGKLLIKSGDLDRRFKIGVAKSPTPENNSRWTFRTNRIDYVIDVLMAAPYSGPYANLPEYTIWRDTILDVFSAPPLVGAPEVFDVTSRAGVFVGSAGESTEWDFQKVEVIASVETARRPIGQP